MLQRVYIQILDNPTEGILFSKGDSFNNKMVTEELKEELNNLYPSVAYVEYIDLFMDEQGEFDEIRELLSVGAIDTPVVLINGVLRLYGGISPSLIKKEVEKLLTSGPIH
ncbi:MAG: thioredoxin family protein [Nitrospira sp.]|nr:thioredoxin family protein [Nitrospira sp.]